MLACANCILSALPSAFSEAFMKQSHTTQCLIVGGCSAGLMLGVLLARAGVSVRLLEKHADFLRDFRGETIHRSTKEAAADWLRALRFERSETPAPINVRPPAFIRSRSPNTSSRFCSPLPGNCTTPCVPRRATNGAG